MLKLKILRREASIEEEHEQQQYQRQKSLQQQQQQQQASQLWPYKSKKLQNSANIDNLRYIHNKFYSYKKYLILLICTPFIEYKFR